MTKAELAVEKHSRGYNCCQAVACAYAKELGMDEGTLYRVCEGFGAGMGTGFGICGALSGCAVLAGLVNSNGDIENAGQTKAQTTRLAGKMQRDFEERVGAIYCRDIKSGNDGRGLTSCANCIAIAAEIAEELFR